MKIQNGEMRPIVNSTRAKVAYSEATKPTSGKSGFDKIMISRTSPEPMSESKFAAMLKSEISSEVKAGASQSKIEDLKRQVALGQYDINPAEIARKIMLDA